MKSLSPTAFELQSLTQHLVRQPSPQSVLAELIHYLRVSGVDLVHPAHLPGDIGADRLNRREPLIAHIPGRYPRVVLIGAGFERPESPLEEFSGGMAQGRFNAMQMAAFSGAGQEFDDDGTPRNVVGPGALTTAAPLAIGVELVRQLKHAAHELQGHVIFVAAPEAHTGGLAFEQAGRRVREIMRQYRLKPMLALVPGRVAGHVSRRTDLVLTTGSAGLITLNVLVFGQMAAPTAHYRGLDPVAVASMLVRTLTMNAGLGAHLPPPLASNIGCGPAPAPGWPALWASATLTWFVHGIEPAALMERVREICDVTLNIDHAERTQTFNRLAKQLGRHLGKNRSAPPKPTVLDYRELRRLCRYEMPPVKPLVPTLSPAEALAVVQGEALRRMRFAYENSPHAGTPVVVLGFAPPCIAPFNLESENTSCFGALKKSLREFEAQRAKLGLFGDGWQRLAAGSSAMGWSGKGTQTVQEQSPLGDEPAGFGLYTDWGEWPLIGFGPFGRDAGAKTESVTIDPSFTRLPDLLKSLILRVLSNEDAPRLSESVWSKMREISSKFGFGKKPTRTIERDETDADTEYDDVAAVLAEEGMTPHGRSSNGNGHGLGHDGHGEGNGNGNGAAPSVISAVPLPARPTRPA